MSGTHVEPKNFGDMRRQADQVSVLKKRKVSEKMRENKAAAAKRKKTENKNKIQAYKSAEKFVKEYRQMAKQKRTLNRKAAQVDNEVKTRAHLPEQASRLMFVIRSRGASDMHPKANKILNSLDLKSIDNAVFVESSPENLKMIQMCDAYLTYGYPNSKSVQDLIYKRGFAKVGNTRVPLNDNAMVEKALGKYGIVCVEDVVNEISTLGENFKQVNQFLWPFKMRTGDKKKALPKNAAKKEHIKPEKSNKQNKINDIIQKLM